MQSFGRIDRPGPTKKIRGSRCEVGDGLAQGSPIGPNVTAKLRTVFFGWQSGRKRFRHVMSCSIPKHDKFDLRVSYI